MSISRAAYFPTLSANASASHSRAGFDNNSIGAVIGKTGSDISNSFNTELEASWVPDLWGKVRRTVESSVASAQATALNNQRSQISVTGNRLIASVALIAALGGAWNAAELPLRP